jgi:hypothetical protein
MKAVINEIESFFSKVYGGLYLEINSSCLDYLKNRNWNKIVLENPNQTNLIQEINDINMSTLIHVAILNCDTEFLRYFLNELYSSYKQDPKNGGWRKQILFLIIKSEIVSDELSIELEDLFYTHRKLIGDYTIYTHRLLDYAY